MKIWTLNTVMKCSVALLFMKTILADNLMEVISDNDTVIIQARYQDSPTTSTSKRQARNIFYRTTWSQALGEGNPCITSQGLLGSCTSFRHCYPYFKLPQIGLWESWLLGNYDACSYFSDEGRQAFGVCCTNTIAPIPPDQQSNTTNQISGQPVTPVKFGSGFGTRYPYWPPPVPTHPPGLLNQPVSTMQWPPPLPTHPPNHTAATHPPAYYPPTQGITTTTSRPTLATWPPATGTTKPPVFVWPPIAPTHPPPTKPPYQTTIPPYQTTRPPYVPPTTQAPPTIASCGAKNIISDQERIVGGNIASPNEWPWMAVLFNSGTQFCGGSLVDGDSILTAAHCIAHMTAWDVAKLKVHLGDYDIRSRSEVQHQEFTVRQLIKHRGFDPRTLYNDIAILKLNKPVTFTNNIHPICLPGPQKLYSGQTATVAGWGSLQENGPTTSVLRNVNIKVWSNEECRRKYGPAAPGGIVEHMICAGTAARDSCSGDSGGPLMVNEGSRWTQVGVVSWGIGCGKGQYPGVYSRVSYFLPWIQKNLARK